MGVQPCLRLGAVPGGGAGKCQARDAGGELVRKHPADGAELKPGQEVTLVSDVMRAGYAWQGRVIRPAMVKVKG